MEERLAFGVAERTLLMQTEQEGRCVSTVKLCLTIYERTWSQIRSHFFSLSYCLRSRALSGGRFMEFWKRKGKHRRHLQPHISQFSVWPNIWASCDGVSGANGTAQLKLWGLKQWPHFLCWLSASHQKRWATFPPRSQVSLLLGRLLKRHKSLSKSSSITWPVT